MHLALGGAVGSETGTVLVFAGVALLLAIGYMLVWRRDKRNADQVAADPQRLEDPDEAAVDLAGDDSTMGPMPPTNVPR